MHGSRGRDFAAVALLFGTLGIAAPAAAQQAVRLMPFEPATAGFMIGDVGKPTQSLLPSPGISKADAPTSAATPDGGRPTPFAVGRENGGVVGFSYRLQPNPQTSERRISGESYPGRPAARE